MTTIDYSQIVKCIRCGACQSVCPIFDEKLAESTVARGKVRLIGGLAKGEVEPSDRLEELLSFCLSCKACVKSCPSGVATDQLVETARAHLVSHRGLSPLKKFIFRTLMRNNWLFDFSLKTGSIFQGVALRTSPTGQGKLPRIPLGLDKRRLVKPLAKKTLRSSYPEIVGKEHKKIVAFYTGCMINYMAPNYGKAVIECLLKNGCRVIIPKNQQCCGTPARANGDKETADLLAQANEYAFKDLSVDTIITGCASCGLTLKEQTNLAATKEIVDFTEFIVRHDNWKQDLGLVDAMVTYHDPCHLKRGQGVDASPREILKAIPGLEYRELQNADRCCGAAGSFSLRHYDLSKKINDKKAANIVATQADWVASACGSCLMHIEDGLARNNSNIKGFHIAEVLAQSYKNYGKGVV
ncbi:glycolate oxidase iron-sulfur subunit [Desulfitispora alkaliphila]|uniref:(Fe-S)-binding protein n=1 Tax=Desulfitispora alkaliphila TaxID=622674 RepID=UPI003D1C03A1